MNILHITDLHFKSKTFDQFSQDQIINKLCSDVSVYKNTIDLIVFTGDLVFSGIDIEDFKKACIFLIDRLTNELNLSKENVIFCAGNHDVNRDSYLQSLEDLFSNKINSSNELYEFINNKDQDYINSLEGISNYNEFIKQYYSSIEDNRINDLYSTHIRNINGVKVGVVSINSGWRALSDDCKNELLFPAHLLEVAMSEIDECQCKLLLVHHPLYWFKEFNYLELQELIHKNFDVIFSGHVHDSNVSTHYKYSNGIFDHVAAASMTYDRNYVGYSYIEYDLTNKSRAKIIESKFIKQFNDFKKDEEVNIVIPTGLEKENQNRLRSKMLGKLKAERIVASDLLLDNSDEEEEDDIFMKSFTAPVIKNQTQTNTTFNPTKTPNVFDNLLINKNNYLIFGHDKSGKTSLLKYIQINHLKKYSINGNIPFYIDFKELSSIIDNDWDLIKHMSRYYEINLADTKKLIETHEFRLLIDNFNPHSILFQKINEFLLQYPNVNFIICSDHITSRIVDNYLFAGKEYQKLYFHDITRTEMRSYTDKRLKMQVEKKEEVLDKLIAFCKQMEMPLNFWTISILLLIHKKSQFDLSKNLFEILDLCADEILNKKYVTVVKSKITFNQLKTLCGDIAYKLLTIHNETSYSTSYLILLTFIEEKIDGNIRLRADGKEILDYLIETGLLKYKEDDTITFRLNGIFEYFVAYYLSNNPKIINKEILNKDEIYLSFKNEFEIYSGLNNNDDKFLKDVFNKTKGYFEEVNNGFAKQGTPDKILKGYVSVDNKKKMEKIAKEIQTNTPLTNEEKDILMDEFDPINISKGIESKKIYNVEKLDSEIFERYLSMLARVYKTMDNISDSSLLNEIFDFLLETYINYGFYLVKEFENEKLFKDLTDQDSSSEDNILTLLSKIIPIITQSTFSDGIAHFNVEGIILNKIKELKEESADNQYKVFILYFLLMDIDERNITLYSDDLIDYSKMNVIKFSTLCKLKYYHTFNGHNKRISEFLEQKIKDVQIKLDNKTDKDRLQQDLSKNRKYMR